MLYKFIILQHLLEHFQGYMYFLYMGFQFINLLKPVNKRLTEKIKR